MRNVSDVMRTYLEGGLFLVVGFVCLFQGMGKGGLVEELLVVSAGCWGGKITAPKQRHFG